MDTDLVLIERWRKGDDRAAQELFTRHFDDVYRFFEHKALGSADELAQETLANCFKSLKQFEGRSSFRTYLFTIARNELYKWLRTKRPSSEYVDLEVSSLNELVSSPSTRFAREEEKQQLVVALRSLPVDQQILLELHYWYDCDAAVLAEILQTSTGAVRVRLHRARVALRDRMVNLSSSSADPLVISLITLAADQSTAVE